MWLISTVLPQPEPPTTGLDPTSAAHVHDLIVATHEAERPGEPARTSVIITHDKDLLNRLRPRTVLLHQGKVLFDGTLEEFEASTSSEIRPYFEVMPMLHKRRLPVVGP